MPWNLLLLPLVAGYFFLTRSYFFKYRYRLLDKQRLLFESVIAATFFLVAAYVLALFLKPVLNARQLALYLQYRPFPYTGTAVLSLTIGVVLAYLPNLFLSREKAMIESIRLHGTGLDKLVLEATLNPQQLCFTLENGKVYIGYPQSITDLLNQGTLSILPFFSGYRNEEQDIIITTFYDNFYLPAAAPHAEEEEMEEPVHFEQLISVKRIVSAKRFDIDVYDRFGDFGDESEAITEESND
jgi:hypothetical protein